MKVRRQEEDRSKSHAFFEPQSAFHFVISGWLFPFISATSPTADAVLMIELEREVDSVGAIPRTSHVQ